MITVQAIHLGPIMLPWGVVILMLALCFAGLIGQFSHKYFAVTASQWIQFKDAIWTAIIIGLVCARLGYVVLNWNAYLAHPIEIIKIQDKGFHLYIGIITGFIYIFCKNRKLSKRFTLMLCAIFMLICISGHFTHQHLLSKYQQFPKVSLLNLQHENVELNQFLGKATVINLWASWCPPCRREMPVLDAAQKNHPDVQFVFINQNEDAKTVSTYLKQQQLNLAAVLLDPQGITAQQTGMFGLPSTLFFNAQGQLVDTHMGELTHAALQQKIQKIVAE